MIWKEWRITWWHQTHLNQLLWKENFYRCRANISLNKDSRYKVLCLWCWSRYFLWIGSWIQQSSNRNMLGYWRWMTLSSWNWIHAWHLQSFERRIVRRRRGRTRSKGVLWKVCWNLFCCWRDWNKETRCYLVYWWRRDFIRYPCSFLLLSWK